MKPGRSGGESLIGPAGLYAEAVSPPEVRADLATVAAEVVAKYTGSNMRLDAG